VGSRYKGVVACLDLTVLWSDLVRSAVPRWEIVDLAECSVHVVASVV
jgi:hypothetical protein